MSTIDINELLDYMICPLRLSFPNKSVKYFDTYYNVKSYIYSKLFDHCLLTRISDHKISITNINNKLNYIWDDIKKDISIVLSILDKVAIKNKISYLYNLLNNIDSVVYFDIPRTIQISDTEILYKFSSYYTQKEFITVVKFSNLHLGLTENSSTVRIVSNLIQNDLRTIDDKYKHRLKLFRCDTGEMYSTIEAPVKDVINSIIRGLESKIFYPKTDYLSCKTCFHTKECMWSLNE